MTLTADSKKRVCFRRGAPGDVFACGKRSRGDFETGISPAGTEKKKTKAQALKAIRSWTFKPAMTWEELRN